MNNGSLSDAGKALEYTTRSSIWILVYIDNGIRLFVSLDSCSLDRILLAVGNLRSLSGRFASNLIKVCLLLRHFVQVSDQIRHLCVDRGTSSLLSLIEIDRLGPWLLS